jgi:hypothetical protein
VAAAAASVVEMAVSQVGTALLSVQRLARVGRWAIMATLEAQVDDCSSSVRQAGGRQVGASA